MATVEKPRTFLHLSDIHFRPQPTAFELDAHLRAAVENDLPVVRANVGEIDGILVTGDIAQSGHPDEFRRGSEWLDKLCELAGCRPDRVWTTPGNHDVDRKFIKDRISLKDFYAKVRRRGSGFVDHEINAALQDELGPLMFAGIQNYNDFAARYSCDVAADRPFWQQEILLNDSSVLRLRGLSSTLISDENDHQDGGRLIIGQCQLGMARPRGVETLTLCHHPLPWLIDQEKVETRLSAFARVQLFGHKHSQRIQRVDETVRIIAGAVHPDRREQHWDPRYNVLSLEVLGEGATRSLKVSTHLRVWHEEHQKFVPDTNWAPDGGCRTEVIKLETWTKPKGEPMNVVPDDENRRLVYKFYSLEHGERRLALEKMGIAVPASADLQFFRKSLSTLEKGKHFGEFWDAINVVAEEDEQNPFASKARGEK